MNGQAILCGKNGHLMLDNKNVYESLKMKSGDEKMKMANKFEYTYSAKQQKEIEAIKKKYVPKEEDKMETLRRLDKSAEKQGTIWALVLGIVGTLIFGGGMSLTLVGSADFMVLGIIIGVIGIAVLGVAYPVYKNVTKKQREKIAPQILALSEELLK